MYVNNWCATLSVLIAVTVCVDGDIMTWQEGWTVKGWDLYLNI